MTKVNIILLSFLTEVLMIQRQLHHHKVQDSMCETVDSPSHWYRISQHYESYLARGRFPVELHSDKSFSASVVLPDSSGKPGWVPATWTVDGTLGPPIYQKIYIQAVFLPFFKIHFYFRYQIIEFCVFSFNTHHVLANNSPGTLNSISSSALSLIKPFNS